MTVSAYYEQADSPGVHTPGWDCENCGRPGHEHDLMRDTDEEGRIRYRYRCPEGFA